MNFAGENKLRVGLVYGGRSSEHEVSRVSARSVMGAMNPDKYEVIPVGITKKGSWVVGALPESLSDNSAKAIPTLKENTGRAGLNCDPHSHGLVLLDKPDQGKQVSLDVVFPLVHGNNGEDGSLQGFLELAGLPYVGCSVLSSAVGMDKTFSKRLFKHAGLKVGHFIEILRSNWRKKPADTITTIEAEFDYPCFVKPVNSGSSVGISKAYDRKELTQAINLAAKYDRKILVEQFIEGREIEVSVLGNDEPIASVPGEIVPCNDFYDYSAKYVDNKSELVIPANISPELSKQVRELAIKAYKALDCSGMARVDFFLDKETGSLVINEINSIPGFTQISMYPKLWEATGISYSELVDRLIELAIERHRDRQESLSACA